MTSPRWFIRLAASLGLELRTLEDRGREILLQHSSEALLDASATAFRNLQRAHAAEIRADELEAKLALVSGLLRDALALMHGELDIPDFRAARSTELPRVPRHEPEQVAA